IAGHETTAVSLAWTLYALHRHPETLARARAEVDAVGDDASPEALARLPYLGAVIDETLRRYPIIDVVFRRLLRPATFAGYEVPAGVILCPAIVLVHQDPNIYPDPERFDPERFLGKKPRPHEYLPFGGGNRRCIGAAFSLYESRLALATVLRELELELLDGELPAVRKNIVLAPKGGVRMRLRARR
ncbi:MAG: cytochrome P450, partial [Myxococcales bacterium]|nr:cytochrome P450 [Myxococcales bacterium]